METENIQWESCRLYSWKASKEMSYDSVNEMLTMQGRDASGRRTQPSPWEIDVVLKRVKPSSDGGATSFRASADPSNKQFPSLFFVSGTTSHIFPTAAVACSNLIHILIIKPTLSETFSIAHCVGLHCYGPQVRLHDVSAGLVGAVTRDCAGPDEVVYGVGLEDTLSNLAHLQPRSAWRCMGNRHQIGQYEVRIAPLQHGGNDSRVVLEVTLAPHLGEGNTGGASGCFRDQVFSGMDALVKGLVPEAEIAFVPKSGSLSKSKSKAEGSKTVMENEDCHLKERIFAWMCLVSGAS